MLPRCGRVLSRINRISSFQRNSELVKKESSFFLIRDYAKVAAAVEPDAKSDVIKPEVNLNKLFWSKPRSLALAADSPYRIEDPQYEGFKRFMLTLMLYYSKQSRFIRSANAIYRRVTYQVDRPPIYDVFSLDETFKTTFSLLVLHMWLCLRRLKEEGKDGVELGQYLFEMYNHDLELRVSKAGVNLLLSKWMKELEKIFYGNVVAYDAAIGKDEDLQNVIWRNVFSDDGTSKPIEGALLSVQVFLCSPRALRVVIQAFRDESTSSQDVVDRVTEAWTSRCTHMVIDDFMPINDEIINSIVARKPLVRFSWIELIAGKTICTEIPSSLSHAPTLILEGASLKVADQQSREKCLKGYTFMLESTHKYKFKEKLHLLLDAGGAKVVYVETSDQHSQNTGDNLVCVMPAGMTSCSESFKKFSALPTVNEIELISAVVSGHLDPSVMASAPVLVTSSCSTDETVVADSDAELETATSVRTSAAINLISSAKDECETKMGIHETEPLTNCKAETFVHVIESIEHGSGAKTDAGATEHGSQGFLPPKQETFKCDSPYRSPIMSDKADITLSRDRDEDITTRKDKGHLSESENLDIIYSQSLIVRDSNSTRLDHSSRNGPTVNFKRFRKTSAASDSGNSFYNLIPFAKYPYKESDYGNEDVAESIKEEKKRKQMEAIADDLFNNEKGRRRGASGTLPALFGRG